MAPGYRWILPICFILCAGSVVGDMKADTWSFAESEGTIFSRSELFNNGPTPNATARLAELRRVMANGTIHAYIIPTGDAHNSAQIAPVDARRAWLSGFLGGAGTAVVTADKSLMWTDGRYFTQFEIETNGTTWELMREGSDFTIQQWLAVNMAAGTYVGVDPTTYTRSAFVALQNALPDNVYLAATDSNLVDTTRRNLNSGPPGRPSNPVITLTQMYTGRQAAYKIAEIVQFMSLQRVNALVLTALDDIAYALNLRGTDIPFSPVFFSYLVFRSHGPTNTTTTTLFYANGTLEGNNIFSHLVLEGLTRMEVMPYSEIFTYLTDLSIELGANGSIWVPSTASQAIFQAILAGPRAANITEGPVTPIAAMKVVKTHNELVGFRNAHRKDGIAVIRALCWLEKQIAGGERVTEIQVSNELARLRGLEDLSMGPSFASIVGAGANGAIIHYRPSSEGEQRVITASDMLLVDSGGHYMDGTTDITRTRHMSNNCTAAQRNMYTRVLKGNINLATSLFPVGIQGHSVDTLARQFLWNIGVNYNHGTGHGVGHFLNIHEGPIRINQGVTPNDPGMFPGMIYSNEPGYYEVGQYGIRHEDIMETIGVTTTSNHTMASGLVGNFEGRGVVGLSAITQVPHQTSCLNVTLMTELEISYLNAFHARIFNTMGPILIGRNLTDEYAWLERETAAITSGAMLIKSTVLAAISVVVLLL